MNNNELYDQMAWRTNFVERCQVICGKQLQIYKSILHTYI